MMMMFSQCSWICHLAPRVELILGILTLIMVLLFVLKGRS